MTANTITLFCWVLGDQDIFSVKIAKEKLIEDLKQTILTTRPNRFQGLDVGDLVLRKKVGLLNDIKRLELSVISSDGVLDAWCQVTDYFEDGRERSICIITVPGM